MVLVEGSGGEGRGQVNREKRLMNVISPDRREVTWSS